MTDIRAIRAEEIPLLESFAPADWNSDLPEEFAFHEGHPYFHPLVAEVDGRVVGCAQGVLNGDAGWLGNIIVLPSFRGRGVGTALTQALMDWFRSRGCAHQILIATALGEPVYRRLGFRVVSRYLFLVRKGPGGGEEPPGIRRLSASDAPRVLALDRAIAGEDRKTFLGRFLAGGWGHVDSGSGSVDGFFLPDLGQGVVLAENDRAGLALLRLKLCLGCTKVVIPEGNGASREFLLRAGFRETGRAPRMALGEDVAWQPRRVYSRGAGYCG